MAHRISRTDLEQLVLNKLKARPACTGARLVAIASGDAARRDSEWQVAFFDSGTSSTDACRKALAAIERCLGSKYTVIDDR